MGIMMGVVLAVHCVVGGIPPALIAYSLAAYSKCISRQRIRVNMSGTKDSQLVHTFLNGPELFPAGPGN